MEMDANTYLLNDENVSQHRYTYQLCDPRTGNVIDELPFNIVEYSYALSSVGQLSVSIPVNAETAAFDLRTNTAPGKMTIYVFRDDVLVWGGIIWKRNYDSSSRSLQIIAKTFESYFAHRLQMTTKYWSNEDQFSIFRWLVQSNGSLIDFDISVSNKISSVKRERTMFGYEFKTTATELDDLASLINGFDWNVEVYVNPETLKIERHLNFWEPERGLSRDNTNLTFEYPGAIKNYTLNEDAESSANSVWAIGAGEGTEMLSAIANDYSQLSAGWPKIEKTRSFKSVLRPSTLQAHANATIERILTPVTVFEVVLRADVEPTFGSYSVGDWARFRFEDIYFFDSKNGTDSDGFINYVSNDKVGSYDRMARITEISVNVDQSGIEEITLTLGGYELAEDPGPEFY